MSEKNMEKFKKFWVVEVNNYLCDASYDGKELKEKHRFPSFRRFRFIKSWDDLKYFTSRSGISNEEIVKRALNGFENDTTKNMENFFIEENFYSDLGEYIDSFYGEDAVLALSDTWYQNAEEADLEPVLKMDDNYLEHLIDNIYDDEIERFPEEPDDTIKKLNKAFMESFDFEKFNKLCPKMYYPNGKRFTITKKDLLEWIEPPTN
jgi:hypothetical protein